MAAKTKVTIVDNRFDRYSREVEDALGRALTGAARKAVRAAEGKSTRGYRIGSIVGSSQITHARRGRKGLELQVAWQDFRAVFFEKGTYQNRRGKLSKRTRRREGSDLRGGIKPVRFMAAARKEAQDELMSQVKREMPG